MSKLRGTGFAAVNYPTGMHLGGDPTQSLVHATTSGNFVVTMSSVDLGQGLKTILAQIAAETLGVPLESVIVDTGDTDTGPHCTGTFASRTTHRAGNAVIMAAAEARKAMLEVAAEKLEVSVEDLETDGRGNIHVKGVEAKSISVAETAGAAHFELGKTISGRGIFLKPPSPMDPETGESDPDSTQAHACTVVEVEVDTETGHVEVLSIKSAYEVGQQINSALVEGQIVGGAWMGIGHALSETTTPYYPALDHAPRDFQGYLMPGPADMPEVECAVLEIPSRNGPFGAKGVGEMVTNSPIPAIVNAVNNALGVRITEIPVTPEVVLRALDEKAAKSA
jgi:CO/xanthine dehydrogenase Mo-binding subunit